MPERAGELAPDGRIAQGAAPSAHAAGFHPFGSTGRHSPARSGNRMVRGPAARIGRGHGRRAGRLRRHDPVAPPGGVAQRIPGPRGADIRPCDAGGRAYRRTGRKRARAPQAQPQPAEQVAAAPAAENAAEPVPHPLTHNRKPNRRRPPNPRSGSRRLHPRPHLPRVWSLLRPNRVRRRLRRPQIRAHRPSQPRPPASRRSVRWPRDRAPGAPDQ